MEEADFCRGGQFLSNRLIFAWKTRTIAQRKPGFSQERVCFSVQQWHQWATVNPDAICHQISIIPHQKHKEADSVSRERQQISREERRWLTWMHLRAI